MEHRNREKECEKEEVLWYHFCNEDWKSSGSLFSVARHTSFLLSYAMIGSVLECQQTLKIPGVQQISCTQEIRDVASLPGAPVWV